MKRYKSGDHDLFYSIRFLVIFLLAAFMVPLVIAADFLINRNRVEHFSDHCHSRGRAVSYTTGEQIE